MAMNYTSLVAAKGTSGSIANWVNYSKLDLPVVLEESQALIFETLRVREMRSLWSFRFSQGQCYLALPSRFLDPIGRVRDITNNTYVVHKDHDKVVGARRYDQTSGSLGTDPLTTSLSSSIITVALTGHGFSQGGMFTMSGATAVGGVTPNGTYPITSVSTDTFTIDVSDAATSAATGGGSDIDYVCDNLTEQNVAYWTIFDEAIQLDAAVPEATTFQMPYYKRPLLLSASNETNFLTTRYPHLIRAATEASAASFMKDDNEYQKAMTRLTALIQSVAIGNDLELRGSELETENP